MDYEALRVPLHHDLRPLAALLAGKGIPHQISEWQGAQVIWVLDAASAELVAALHRRMESGDIEVVQAEPQEQAPQASRATTFLPVTLFLLAASIIGAGITGLSTEAMSWLSFYRIIAVDDGYMISTAPGEYWRLFTPVFLHYGLLHLVFNGLWTWELGRRIEFQQGSVALLLLTLLMGVFSNLAQAWFTPGQLFGGMSGVIYGYLGYLVVWQRFRPVAAFALPKGIVIFMLAWLLICMLGFTELVGLGSIANAAHLGGLVAGVALALATLLGLRLTGR